MTTWREELSWAAGFFDGEGHTRAQAREGRRKPSLRMQITQNDPRVLERFQKALLGMGTIQGPRDRGPGKNPDYAWYLSGYHHCQAAIAMLWMFLDTVKREQAAAAMKVAAWRPGSRDKPILTQGGL